MKLKIETIHRDAGDWTAYARNGEFWVCAPAFGRTEREAKRRLVKKLVALYRAAINAAADLGDELEGANPPVEVKIKPRRPLGYSGAKR